MALEALTTADSAAELVVREGMVLAGGKMPHAHPALKVQKDALSTFSKTWALLGFHRVVGTFPPGTVITRRTS